MSHRLPSLDLLPGFEAAARLLSFTLAAAELHLTQSAVSRQIQALEEQLGVALFRRHHRALELTDAGHLLYPAAAQILATWRAAADRLRAAGRRRLLSVTTTNSFASLWLIPRLARFADAHPEVDVRIAASMRIQDLDREGIDVAIRYCPVELATPRGARLFGESVVPVCSPGLLRDPRRPLAQPADLRHHVLLRLQDDEARTPWLNWASWLEVAGVPDLRPAGNLTLANYEQIVQAAIAGHGIALGRLPLSRELLADGTLVAPFDRAVQTTRAYYVLPAETALERPEAADFIAWVRAEAKRAGRANPSRRGAARSTS